MDLDVLCSKCDVENLLESEVLLSKQYLLDAGVLYVADKPIMQHDVKR